MKNRVEVREKYYNAFTSLQKKRKDNHDDFILIGLILVFFMEYLTNGNENVMMLKAPFIPQIKNIENTRAVVRAVDEALSFRGKLAEPIKEFKKSNQKTLDSLTYIIPKKQPKLKVKREKTVVAKMTEDADLTEDNHKISLYTNKMLFNKRSKIWNTQRDSKVRRTIFHQGIDRQEKPIDEPFTVDGFRAMFPADSSLPMFDRANCRCYLTYR